MNDEQLERFVKLERDLTAEYGPFRLFGLFERRGSFGKWDLVASAEWLSTDGFAGLIFLSGELQKRLDRADLLTLAGSDVVGPNEEFVRLVNRMVIVEHGIAYVGPFEYNDVDIRWGYVITSRKAEIETAAQAA